MGYISAQQTRYSHLISGFMMLAILLFSAGNATAGTVITACNDCHGMPPKDSTRKSNPHFRSYSSATVGSHLTHLPGSPVANHCVVCHGAVVSTVDHQNDGINMAAANAIKGGSYTKGVFFNQTSIPISTNATCSSVNCHFQTVTPNWITTTVPWSSTKAAGDGGNCSSCHKGAAALATGAHTAHITVFGGAGTTASCQKCHPNHDLATTVAFSHATSASRPISITFAAAPNSGSGSYTGGRTGTTFLPTPLTVATGTCSSLYCHSSGKKGQAGMVATDEPASPSWSGVPLDCKGCHGKSTTAGSFVTVAGEPNYLSLGTGVAGANSHLKHVGTAGASTCANCHSKTTTTGAVIIAGGGQHLDTLINYTSGNGKTFGKVAATKTCSNISCHFGGSAQWGATLACSQCHGGPTALGAPILATYKHTIHINNSATLGTNYSCGECHANVVTVGNDTAISNSANHANGLANYSGARAAKSGYTVGSFTTCATYCHSSGKKGQTNMVATIEPPNPSWNNTAQVLDCKGCHGAQAFGVGGVAFTSVAGEPNYTNGGIAATNANSHQKHVGTAGAATCANCHSKTTTTGTTLIAGSQHTDGFINYTAGNGKTFGKVAASKTCSNISCHSGGGIVTGVAAAQWGTTLSCNGCHGDAGSLASGSHTRHLAAGATCNSCHNATASSNTTIGATPANHLNSLITINFNAAAATNATATYNGQTAGGASIYQKANGVAAGTCNTTVCHGGNSGTWGVANVDSSCVKCHGVAGTSAAGYTTDPKTAAPGYNGTGVNTAGTVGTISGGVSADTKVGAHDTHLKGTGGYKLGGVACADCHAVTALGDTGHMNGSTTMTWSSLATNAGTLTPGYSAPNCSANYCHGGGFAAAVQGTGTTVSWVNGAYLANAGSVMNTLDCNQCHQSPPTSSPKFAHGGITLGAGNCSGCHNHDGYGDARHINGTLEASGGTCNGCHSYDTVGGAWGSGTHKDGAIAEGWGAHARHIDHLKALAGVTLNADTDTYGSAAFNAVCGVCHSQVPANHTLDNSSQRLINFNGATTYQTGASIPLYNGISGTSSTANAKTCSNISCHFISSPRWQ